ncbi:MAG TPA: glycosyltransferase family 39 protein, partial [Labilithrix sp.]|nr:glycosyltransferase family 39 protein [Labilithrix sp.]
MSKPKDDREEIHEELPQSDRITAPPLAPTDDAEPEMTMRFNARMLAASARAADAHAKELESETAISSPPSTVPAIPVAAPASAEVEIPVSGEPSATMDAEDGPPAKAEAPKITATVPTTTEELSLGARVAAWARDNVDHLVGGGLGLVYVIWLLSTARSLGFSRDEGFYFAASSEYERWYHLLFTTPSKAFERAAIDQSWASNHEHPSLMKSLFALSHHFFWTKWKVFADQSTAFRLPGMLSMGLALWVTYLFGARAFSRRAGIIAAVALGLMPNVFYHAHLACFDVPIMAMWVTCVFTYWCAEKNRGFGWALVAGVVYGLTLETKHNAWMLPAVFVPHALLVHGRAMAEDTTKTGRLPIPASLVMMATVGPAVFVALWPWLWNDTLPRIQEYVNFHLHHDYYNIEFLGVTYFGPPSPKSYMPVMIAATVPTVTLVLFAIGAFARARVLVARAAKWLESQFGRTFAWPKEAPPSDPLHTDALLFLALAVPLSVFLLPRTPIFGGTKHWITAYPALALFAGRGFDLVATQLETTLRQKTSLDALKRNWIIALVGAITFMAPFAVTRHSHPFGLSTYVPFFGGTAGGADLGLNRQFWGFTTQSLDPWFSKNTKPGDTVYIMDTAWQSWQRMVDEKRIPQWLRGVGSPAEAEISIVHHEQHMNEVDYNIWTEYGSS